MKPTVGMRNVIGALHQTESLRHSLQRLGSLGGILVAPDLQIMERVSHKLQRVMQADRKNEIVVRCLAALRLLLCTPLDHRWEGGK